ASFFSIAAPILSFISAAAASVKVTIRRRSTSAGSFSSVSLRMIRSTRTAVFPDPAAADTRIFRFLRLITFCCSSVHFTPIPGSSFPVVFCSALFSAPLFSRARVQLCRRPGQRFLISAGILPAVKTFFHLGHRLFQGVFLQPAVLIPLYPLVKTADIPAGTVVARRGAAKLIGSSLHLSGIHSFLQLLLLLLRISQHCLKRFRLQNPRSAAQRAVLIAPHGEQDRRPREIMLQMLHHLVSGIDQTVQFQLLQDALFHRIIRLRLLHDRILDPIVEDPRRKDLLIRMLSPL